jgi:hypothetical protein
VINKCGTPAWCFPNGGDGVNSRTASSGVAYERKDSLPGAVMDAIKPVCRDVAGVAPLKKCFPRKTHNRNESVRSVIWTRISKTVL